MPFLSSATAYTFPTASLPLRIHCKRKILFPVLSPSTPFSCIFSFLAAVYLCLMWKMGVGAERRKSWGHKVTIEKKKTRTRVKRDGERRGTGVAHGEQNHLINTNPGSKLFRRASNNLLSLACGMHQTDEPIR